VRLWLLRFVVSHCTGSKLGANTQRQTLSDNRLLKKNRSEQISELSSLKRKTALQKGCEEKTDKLAFSSTKLQTVSEAQEKVPGRKLSNKKRTGHQKTLDKRSWKPDTRGFRRQPRDKRSWKPDTRGFRRQTRDTSRKPETEDSEKSREYKISEA